MIMARVFDMMAGGKLKFVNTFFSWVGGFSLEIYLVHVEFILKPIERHHWGYWPTFFLTLAISLPIAWVIHKVCEVIINKVQALR